MAASHAKIGSIPAPAKSAVTGTTVTTQPTLLIRPTTDFKALALARPGGSSFDVQFFEETATRARWIGKCDFQAACAPRARVPYKNRYYDEYKEWVGLSLYRLFGIPAPEVALSLQRVARVEKGAADIDYLNPCLHIMSKYVEGFHPYGEDFLAHYITSAKGQKNYLSVTLPGHAKTAIPLKGFGAALAVADFLYDLDCVGRSGKNIGYVIKRDASGKVYARTVKIDAGLAFNFLEEYKYEEDKIDYEHQPSRRDVLYAPGKTKGKTYTLHYDQLTAADQQEFADTARRILATPWSAIEAVVQRATHDLALTSTQAKQLLTKLFERKKTFLTAFYSEVDTGLRREVQSEREKVLAKWAKTYGSTTALAGQAQESSVVKHMPSDGKDEKRVGSLVSSATFSGLKTKEHEITQLQFLLQGMRVSEDKQAEKTSKCRVFQTPTVSAYFTGREALLAELATTLHRQKGGVISQGISGIGGVGKTQVAARYVELAMKRASCGSHQLSYDAIIWLYDGPNLGTQLVNLAAAWFGIKEMSLEETLVAIHQRLQHQHVLMVFDNAEEASSLTPILDAFKGGSYHILITSRNSQWVGIPTLKLDGFTHEEGQAYVKKQLGDAKAEEITALLETVAYLPLALSHAVIYVREGYCTLAEYPRQFALHQLSLGGTSTLSDSGQTVMTTFLLTVARLLKDYPAIESILKACAYFSPENIPFHLLYAGLEKNSEVHLAPQEALNVLIKRAMETGPLADLANERLMLTIKKNELVELLEKNNDYTQQKQAEEKSVKTKTALQKARQELEEVTAQIEKVEKTHGKIVAEFQPPASLQVSFHYDELKILRTHLLKWYKYSRRVIQSNIGVLIHHGLLQSGERDTVNMHRLVQAAARSWHQQTQGEGNIQQDLLHWLICLMVLLAHDENNMSEMNQVHRFVSHAWDFSAFCKFSDDQAIVVLMRVLSQLGIHQMNTGQYPFAQKIHERAILVEKARQKPSSLQIARLLGNIAIIHENIGDEEKARLLMEEVLTIEKTTPEMKQDAEMLAVLGSALRNQKRFDEALQYVDASLKLRPKHAPTLMLRGIILNVLDRNDEALASYEESANMRPNYPLLLANKGTALTALKRYPEALACFQEAVKLRPTSANLQANLAGLLHKVGRAQEALQIFEELFRLQPDCHHPTILHSYFVVLVALGHHNKVLLHYDKLLRLQPDNKELLKGKADALHQWERYQEAVLVYDRLLELKPDDADVLLNQGLTFAQLSRHEDALKNFNKSLQLRPKHAITLGSRGNALQALGRYEAALQDFNESLLLQPNEQAVLANRGLTFYFLGRYQEALQDCDASLSIDSTIVDNYKNRGVILRAMKRYLEALQSYNIALEKRPFDPKILTNRANVLCDLHRYEEALGDYNESLKREPGDAKALHGKSDALDKLNRSQEALENYNELLRHWPNDVQALAKRGRIFYQQKCYGEALRDLDQALTINPVDTYALQIRQFVLESKEEEKSPVPATPTSSIPLAARGTVGISSSSLPSSIPISIIRIPSRVELLLPRAQELFQAGRYAEAISVLTEVLKRDPTNEMGIVMQGCVLTCMGKMTEALQHFDYYLVLKPHSPVLWRTKADLLYMLNRYPEAAAAMEEVIKIEPKNIQILEKLADTLFRLKRYSQLIQVYNQILTLAPDKPDILFEQGNVFNLLGNYSQALKNYNKYLELCPKEEKAYINAGVALRALGCFAEAAQHYKKALEIWPAHPALLMNMGNTLCDIDHDEEALGYYEQALKITPNNPVLLANTGNTLKVLGRNDEALAHYEKSLLARPHHAGTLMRRAQILQAKGLYAAALQGYDDSLKINSNDNEILFHKASVLADLKRHEESHKILLQLLKTQPNHPDLLRAKANLEAKMALIERKGEVASTVPASINVTVETQLPSIVPTLVNHQGLPHNTAALPIPVAPTVAIMEAKPSAVTAVSSSSAAFFPASSANLSSQDLSNVPSVASVNCAELLNNNFR